MDLLRRATPADARALTRLREYLHDALGQVVTAELAASWRQECVVAFERRLAHPDFVAFVVEVDGEVVSGGVGWLEEHLPSPFTLDPVRGHIASMCTAPGHERLGHARRVFQALMGWFGDQGVQRVNLRATAQGQPLYEAFGFTVSSGAAMTWSAAAPSSVPAGGHGEPRLDP